MKKTEASVVVPVIGRYVTLIPFFLYTLIQKTSLDIFVLTDQDTAITIAQFLTLWRYDNKVQVITAPPIDGIGSDAASQACGLKLACWEHLPAHVKYVAILDCDLVVLDHFLDELLLIGVIKHSCLSIARDTYIGYKERMGEDFAVLGEDWSPQFDTKGRLYCNTGLIGASRKHRQFFLQVLNEWRRFVRLTGTTPPLWDQGIFNFCLDIGKFGISWSDIYALNRSFNALKEYDVVLDLDKSKILLDGEQVLLLHFNGGGAVLKYARRARSVQLNVL